MTRNRPLVAVIACMLSLTACSSTSGLSDASSDSIIDREETASQDQTAGIAEEADAAPATTESAQKPTTTETDVQTGSSVEDAEDSTDSNDGLIKVLRITGLESVVNDDGWISSYSLAMSNPDSGYLFSGAHTTNPLGVATCTEALFDQGQPYVRVNSLYERGYVFEPLAPSLVDVANWTEIPQVSDFEAYGIELPETGGITELRLDRDLIVTLDRLVSSRFASEMLGGADYRGGELVVESSSTGSILDLDIYAYTGDQDPLVGNGLELGQSFYELSITFEKGWEWEVSKGQSIFQAGFCDDLSEAGIGEWSLVTLGADSEPTDSAPLLPGASMRIDRNGSISGSTSCQSFEGRIRHEFQRIVTSDITLSGEPCVGEAAEAEAILLASLGVDSIVIEVEYSDGTLLSLSPPVDSPALGQTTRGGPDDDSELPETVGVTNWVLHEPEI